MTRTQSATFLEFETEIGRSQNSHFPFLNIARRSHTTQSDPIFLNLSQASYMFGRVDIKWVTFMRAGGRYVNSNLFQWEVPACLIEFLCWCTPKLDQDSLSQWPTFKLLGISYVIRKINFKLLFHVPLAEYINGSLHTMPENEKNQGGCHTKRQGTCFNPHFPRQSVNCYGQDNRVCC